MRYKDILFALSAAAMLWSCSNEREPGQQAAEEREVTLSLTVNSGLSPLTRSAYDADNPAPRHLADWCGEQAVNDMRVYVFGASKAGGPYLYCGGGDCADGAYSVPEFDNEYPWDGGSPSYNENYQRGTYTFRPRLAEGRYYRFLAVGRDDKRGTDIPTRPINFVPWGTKVFGDADVKVGVTDIDKVCLTNTLNFTHYPYVTTEVFSGKSRGYIYVDEHSTGFNETIELTRAVAGFWFYVTDIPTHAVDNSGREGYDGIAYSPNELTVYLTYASNTLDVSGQKDGGTSADNYGNMVQIGYVDFTNRYGEFHGKPWYKSDGNPYWQRAEIPNYYGMRIAANSVVMSGFIIPIDETHMSGSDLSTLTLQLRERETDYTFLKQVHCKIVRQVDPATGATSTAVKVDDRKFPIIANYLYTLGTEDTPYSLKVFESTRSLPMIECTAGIM